MSQKCRFLQRECLMKERSDGYFQISLMNVFRQAAREKDSKDGGPDMTDEQDHYCLQALADRQRHLHK